MKARDYQGLVAMILAVGLVIQGLALLTDIGADSSKLDSTLLATLFGGLLASLGQFLSGDRKQKDRDNNGSSEQE